MPFLVPIAIGVGEAAADAAAVGGAAAAAADVGGAAATVAEAGTAAASVGGAAADIGSVGGAAAEAGSVASDVGEAGDAISSLKNVGSALNDVRKGGDLVGDFKKGVHVAEKLHKVQGDIQNLTNPNQQGQPQQSPQVGGDLNDALSAFGQLMGSSSEEHKPAEVGGEHATLTRGMEKPGGESERNPFEGLHHSSGSMRV
jgi:hypothetical protein